MFRKCVAADLIAENAKKKSAISFAMKWKIPFLLRGLSQPSRVQLFLTFNLIVFIEFFLLPACKIRPYGQLRTISNYNGDLQ